MADRLRLNLGTQDGAFLATDEIIGSPVGDAHFQLIKLGFGALETFTIVTGSAGLPTDPLDRAARDLGKVDIALLDQYTPIDVDSGAGVENALPITIRVAASGGSIPETYGAGAVAAGTKRVTLGSDDPAVVALQILDDWDESDRAKVNLILGQAGITGGAGAVGATTPRITLASDDPGVVALQLIDDIVHSGDVPLSKYAVIGAVLDDTSPVAVTENQAQSLRMTSARALHVSVRDALPAGANNIGTVELSATALAALETITIAQVTAAIPAGTNNIGDVDVLTLPALPAGTNNIGDVDVLTLPALPAGTNNIGDVDVLTVPADPFGANADAASATGSISAKLRFLAATGIAGMTALPAGTNNIGDVDVLTLPALPAGTNNIGDVDVLTLPALPAGTNNIGDVDVLTLPALPAGTNNIGDVDILSIAAGANLIGNVGIGVRTSGGCTIFRSLDLDETEEEVKATAGQVYGFYFHNAATTARYLKFYNATAATVVVGTTTPVMTLPLPFASSGGVAGWISLAPGVPFSTAITVAVTTGLADNDTGAPGANDVQVNILYA